MLLQTLSNLFSRPATRPYPFEVRAPPPGARGRLDLDLEVCVFCGICARKCPCGAITVSREAGTFDLEPLRCVSCGACVEGCTKHSLSLGQAALPVQGAPGLREHHHRELPKPAAKRG
jgi:formate hydrogenlyase subunit 6/NADH:ubiquinone oxidoreductase subunit I